MTSSILTQLTDMVETAQRPSLLGVLGKKIERQAKDDLASYFRLLAKDVDALELGKFAEMDMLLARDAATVKVTRTIRHLSPALLQILSTNIYHAMMAADRQKLILEDGIGDPSRFDHVGLTGQDAAAYASEHSAELVTGINNRTRDLIANAVADGIEEQLGVAGTGRRIRNLMGDMTVSRANTIATTEMNDAMSESELRKMKRIGVLYKQVVLAPDPCEICEENEAQGAIPVDEMFASGDLRTPFHPNCRCAIIGARAPEEEAT